MHRVKDLGKKNISSTDNYLDSNVYVYSYCYASTICLSVSEAVRFNVAR
jgi:hypothetical protein